MNEKYLKDTDELHKIISGISHDFRTPLTASLGYLQMLEKEPGLSPDAREYIQIIREKNLLLKKFSDDFFEVTKLRNRDFEIVSDEVNISRIVSECIIRQYEWLEAKNMECDFSVEEDIICNCNAMYFERIMGNLMSNASKYAKSRLKVQLISKSDENRDAFPATDCGTPETMFVTERRDAGQFKLVVKNDTDAGFENKEALQKVFEPFFRSDSRSGIGTGLGLYVVKLLAERMGMQVSVDFEEEEDISYFSVTVNACPHTLFDTPDTENGIQC